LILTGYRIKESLLEEFFTEFKNHFKSNLNFDIENIYLICVTATDYIEENITRIVEVLGISEITSELKLATCLQLIFTLNDEFKETAELITNIINGICLLKYPHKTPAQITDSTPIFPTEHSPTVNKSLRKKIISTISKGSIREKRNGK
jgi:hypothetical protein